jgi:hypothetical protein
MMMSDGSQQMDVDQSLNLTDCLNSSNSVPHLRYRFSYIVIRNYHSHYQIRKLHPHRIPNDPHIHLHCLPNVIGSISLPQQIDDRQILDDCVYSLVSS